MMAIIFISGLTPGNEEIDREKREGTIVSVMDFERWSSGDTKGSVLAMGVSNKDGVFFQDIEGIEKPIGIRVHIREYGFKYLGFNAELGADGFYYAARLEPNPVIHKDNLKQKYPNSVREEWDTEAEHLKAQELIQTFRNQTDVNTGLSARLASAQQLLKAPSPNLARRTAFLSYCHEPDHAGHAEW